MSKQLFLRTTDKDGRAYGGFQWPLDVGATVTAPDWKPTAKCGGGLHGLLNGEGDSGCLDWSADALWWIVETEGPIIDLGGKHKFQTCRVVAFGPRHEITAKLHGMVPGGAIHGLCLTGGHDSTNTGGHRSTNTGGDASTNTGGHRSTNTGGHRSTNTGGDASTNTGGDASTNTGGDASTNTGGDASTNIGGDCSTNIGGDCSTNIGGDCSTNIGGDCSTLIFLRWIGGRRRALVVYVGEDGIKPDTHYRANDDHTGVIEVTK